MIAAQEAFSLGSRNGGKCSICGTGAQQDGYPTRVISTGIDIDFEGRFDICYACGREIGKLADMVSDEQFKLVKVLYDLSEKENARLLGQIINKDQLISLLTSELRDQVDPSPV
jgi:hypothetical protein